MNIRMLAWILLAVVCLTGCGSSTATSVGPSDPDKVRTTITDIMMPEASGTNVFQNASGTVVMDASHTDQGYVCIKYTGTADKVQVQITGPGGKRTPYPLQLGDYEVVNFVDGDGTYQIDVLEHIEGTTYAIGLSETISVTLESEFAPFLYPNQYSDYKTDSACIAKGQELSGKSSDDLDYVGKVYQYVISNITYDLDFAANIPVNYIPDPDTTMSTGKGICLDYAALTVAMLRSQKIPTRLEVGYSGTEYHAWISVWTAESGWIDRVIEFNGNSWTLMDPTLAASSSSSAVKRYVGDGSHYTLEFEY